MGKLWESGETRPPTTGSSSGIKARASGRPCTCATRSRRASTPSPLAGGSASTPRPSERSQKPTSGGESASDCTTRATAFASERGVPRNPRRTGRLRKRLRASTVVPGEREAGALPVRVPAITSTRHPVSPPGRAVVSVMADTAPIA